MIDHKDVLHATVPDREWTSEPADASNWFPVRFIGHREGASPIRVKYTGKTWFGGWMTGPDYWCDVAAPSIAYAAAIADAAERKTVVHLPLIIAESASKLYPGGR